MSTVHRIGPLTQFEAGTAKRVDIGGVSVAIVRIGDDVYALGDRCSHGDASLSAGEVWCDEREVECPKHGSRFSLTTGEPDSLPATRAVPVYEVHVVKGEIEVVVS